MFNPVVLPLPVALLILAAVTAALIYRDWLDHPAARRRPAPATGRHRFGAVTEPYRPSPWPADQRPFIGAALPDRIAETRKRDGNGMWSWSDANWAGDTRELTAVS